MMKRATIDAVWKKGGAASTREPLVLPDRGRFPGKESPLLKIVEYRIFEV
jgi:hypothetical protein